jgi:hypothetical protein
MAEAGQVSKQFMTFFLKRVKGAAGEMHSGLLPLACCRVGEEPGDGYDQAGLIVSQQLS